MSSFGVNELIQLRAYGCTVGSKATLQNAAVIGSQKFKSSPRMSSEISPVGDFESVDYLCCPILCHIYFGTQNILFTRDLPGVALVITFSTTLFTVHRKI